MSKHSHLAPKMRSLYEDESLTLRQIAERLNVSPQVVHCNLLRDGVRMRPPGVGRPLIDESILRKLYEELSGRRIAAELGCTVSFVYYCLNKLEIPRRRPGSSQPRKHVELKNLAVGESILVSRPVRPKYHPNFYAAAKAAGIRVSVRTIDANFAKLTRVE